MENLIFVCSDVYLKRYLNKFGPINTDHLRYTKRLVQSSDKPVTVLCLLEQLKHEIKPKDKNS